MTRYWWWADRAHVREVWAAVIAVEWRHRRGESFGLAWASEVERALMAIDARLRYRQQRSLIAVIDRVAVPGQER